MYLYYNSTLMLNDYSYSGDKMLMMFTLKMIVAFYSFSKIQSSFNL